MSGDVVPRADIRDHVWSGDTFVDLEQGLNFCIRQIREAPGDTAGTPRFIETLPRRGYRFLMPVTVVPGAGAAETGRVTRLIVLPFRMLRPDPDTDFLASNASWRAGTCVIQRRRRIRGSRRCGRRPRSRNGCGRPRQRIETPPTHLRS